MKYNSIPDALQTKVRIAIISALYNGEKDFNTLKRILELTDGNLSIQISKLEECEYVEAERKIEGKKRRTIYRLTPKGKSVFMEYVEMLLGIVESHENIGKEEIEKKGLKKENVIINNPIVDVSTVP